MNHLVSIALLQKECKKRNSLMFRTFIFINVMYSQCLIIGSTDILVICYVRNNSIKLLEVI